LEEIHPTSTFKYLSSRRYYFQDLNPFSHGKKMVDDAAPNVDGFLWRNSCIFSTRLKSLVGANRAYLHLEIPKLQEVFSSKSSLLHTGKQCATCCSF
jgi:hypothetical protein